MSFFGIARPADISWSIVVTGPGNTGGSFISDQSKLNDGRPDSVTRMTWLAGAGQTTASVFHLRGEWAASFVPRAVYLSNISLPVGTKVSAAWRRPADSAGTYPYVPTTYNNGQRVFLGPRGERTCAILLPDGASACVGVDIQIANDVNGSASIAASTPFAIGEAVPCPGVDVDVAAGWSLRTNDPTMSDENIFDGLFPEPGSPYRTWNFAFGFPDNNDMTRIFGDPASPATIDYEELLAYMDRGQSVLYVPRYRDGAGAFSAQMLHRTAFLGYAQQLPSWDQASGTFFGQKNQALVRESPIPT